MQTHFLKIWNTEIWTGITWLRSCWWFVLNITGSMQHVDNFEEMSD